MLSNQQKFWMITTLLMPTIVYAVEKVPPVMQPQGSEKQVSTKILETGSQLVQNFDPLKNFNTYLVAFHPLKYQPTHQMVAYHYCNQVNEDFMQCMLFDSNTRKANLTGIEYIISEKLFNKLPKEEKEYWHPHNYEILSGQLMAPGIPAAVEKQLMKKKMNSYGKTWHVWMTGGSNMKADPLPYGDAKLAWSFNHDGEVQPDLLQKRDEQLKVNTAEVRKQRQDLVTLAKPQEGVNAISRKFPGPIASIPGVVDGSSKTTQ